MVIKNVHKFRVATISTFNLKKFKDNGNIEDAFKAAVELKPISEGLAIEYFYEPSHCLVIANVYADSDGDYYYQSVGDRIETYCNTWGKVLQFRACLKIAANAIQDALKEKRNEETLD